jgi:hypothetical protein
MSNFELHPHQKDALGKLRNGSILVGGVGSGKSITALAYFNLIAPRKPIKVVTTAKKRDSGEWYSDAMKMALKADLEVFSWNSIKNLTDIEGECFIFDEQRVVGYGVWTDSFLKIAKKNKWLLLSATPADTWMDLVPVFIAHGFYKNKTDFCANHVRWSRFAKYPKVDGYVGMNHLVELRKKIFVEMPHVKTAVREDHFVNVDFDREEQRLLHQERWNIYDNEPIKDAGELVRLLRRSTNSHPSRLEAVRELCRTNPRVIIFYNYNYELDILRLLHTELDVAVAEWNGQLHEPLPTTERWIYIVQYQAGSEGWNCITSDTVVFYSLPYSYRNFEQAKGRIDRINTKYEKLHYYILRSQSIIDRAVWSTLMRKKSFQTSAFARKHWDDPQN